MRSISFLITAIVTLSSLPSRAESPSQCTKPNAFHESDLNAEFGPTRDQGSIGWCYAYGAADLLGHWLNKYGIVKETHILANMVSPVASAILYNSKTRAANLGRFNAHKDFQTTQQDRLAESVAQHNAASDEFLSRIAEWVKVNQELKARSTALLNDWLSLDGLQKQRKLRSEELRRLQAIKEELAQLEIDSHSHASILVRRRQSDVHLRELDFLSNFFYGKAHLYQSKKFNFSLDLQSIQEGEGGQPKTVVDQAIIHGVCLEKDVPSVYVSRSGPIHSLAIHQIFENIYGYLRTSDPALANQAAASAMQIFPNIESKDILARLRDSSPHDPVEDLLLQSCKPIHFPTNRIPIYRIVEGATTNAKMEQLSHLVGQTHPVGLTYNADILKKTGKSLEDSLKKNSTLHFSVLIGQKYDCATKEIHFVLRNSWGKESCTSLVAKFRAETSTAPYTCDSNGNFILPARLVSAGFVEAGYLTRN